MNQTRRRVSKKRVRPFFWFLCILTILLVLTVVVFAVYSAKQSVEGSGTFGASETQNAANDSVNGAVTAVYKKDDIEYLPLSTLTTLGATVQPEDDSIYSLRFSDGTAAYFAENSVDCVINGAPATLSFPARVFGTDFCLPLSFYSDQMTGLTLLAVSDGYSYNANRISFQPQDTQAVISAPTAYLSALRTQPSFSADLSAYESYLNPGDSLDYLTLVNVTHPLSSSYIPTDLLGVADARYSGEYEAKLCRIAAMSVDAFLMEARAEGISDVTVTSGYRSYAEQEYRFNAKVDSLRNSYATLEEAQNAAANSIQWPGKSEHQTGLCCDMHSLPSADESFGDTAAGKWLAENACKFGFILRYPADKTDITGITYEPWHFRYVGRYHATRMYYLNMTLEEYTSFLGLE